MDGEKQKEPTAKQQGAYTYILCGAGIKQKERKGKDEERSENCLQMRRNLFISAQRNQWNV